MTGGNRRSYVIKQTDLFKNTHREKKHRQIKLQRLQKGSLVQQVTLYKSFLNWKKIF